VLIEQPDGQPPIEDGEWRWGTLVSKGFVEYVDTEEEETTMIAMHIRDLAASRWGVVLVM
jgi:hypothetical protein